MRKFEQADRSSAAPRSRDRAGPTRSLAATKPSLQTVLPWLLHGADGAPIQRKPIDAGFGDVIAMAHAATAAGAGPVQRKAASTTTAVATDNDRRAFITESIQFLRGAEQHYATLATLGPSAEPFGNAGSIRRVLTGFRAMMTTQGTMVLDDLNGDPQLYQALRAAYNAAVGALLGGAATLAKRPVAELYDTHRDLIFEWAAPTQQLAGISTPLPPSATQDAATQVVTVPANNVQLEILPDAEVAAAPRAVTRQDISYRTPGFRHQGGHITQFDAVPPLRIRVQTRYPRNMQPDGRSGYGRGTTREDIAAGNTTLRFHEGQHGADYVRFVRTHPAPQFGGRVGMTVAEFNAAIATYRREVTAYSAALDADSLQRTDCVGRTIDENDGRHDDRAQCRP